MPLTQHQIYQLDPNFRTRALRLMTEAQRHARSNHVGSALKGYWNDLDLKSLTGDTATKAAFGAGVALAGTAIVAAGVAAGAVTFGIGPALGVVVGLGVAKSLSEFHYQRSSSRLKRGIRGRAAAAPGGRHTFPVSVLGEAVEKVHRKHTRVVRRATQLGGGFKGLGSKVRHAKTAAKGAFRSRRFQGKTLSTTHNDRELLQRLAEMQYYGQMTFNAVDELLDTVVAARDSTVALAARTYGHILRQVHYTGQHERCRMCCYSISKSDFRASVQRLVAGQHLTRPQAGRYTPGALHRRRFAGRVRREAQQRGRLDPHLAETHFQQSPQGLSRPAVNHDTTALRTIVLAEQGRAAGNGGSDEPGVAARIGPDIASSVGGAAATGATHEGFGTWLGDQAKAGEKAADIGAKVAEKSLGEAGKFGAGVGFGAAIDLLVGWGMTRYKRRKIRSSVLGHQEAILHLLTDLENTDDASAELRDILNSSDAGKGQRVVQKILWYTKKIDKLENAASYDTLKRLIANPATTFEASIFYSCRHASDFWMGIHYALKQYEKLIANLVFLQAILLQYDRSVSEANVGVARGKIVQPGAMTPVRPVHMKAMG